MQKLEVFFDYACPYCLRGHGYLLELLPRFPVLEIDWRPCEAHPRPDRYGSHSDLCVRGMFFALEHGVDIFEYHRRMYEAALVNRVDIEDPRVVSRLVDGLLDIDEFYHTIQGDAYKERLEENNRLAWETCRFPAVPSYRMGGKTLEAVENIGVTKSMLEAFLR